VSLHPSAPAARRAPVQPAPRPVRTFCGFKVTAQLARRPRVLRLLPSAAKGGA
jgi:hypothetical protein